VFPGLYFCDFESYDDARASTGRETVTELRHCSMKLMAAQEQ